MIRILGVDTELLEPIPGRERRGRDLRRFLFCLDATPLAFGRRFRFAAKALALGGGLRGQPQALAFGCRFRFDTDALALGGSLRFGA